MQPIVVGHHAPADIADQQAVGAGRLDGQQLPLIDARQVFVNEVRRVDAGRRFLDDTPFLDDLPFLDMVARLRAESAQAAGGDAAEGGHFVTLPPQRVVVGVSGLPELLLSGQVEVDGLDVRHDQASAIDRSPLVFARAAAFAPALVHVSQNLAANGLRAIVAKLKFGRRASLVEQAQALFQALANAAGFQPARVRTRGRLIVGRLLAGEIDMQRYRFFVVPRCCGENPRFARPAPCPAGDPDQVARRQLARAGGMQQQDLGVGGLRRGRRLALSGGVHHFAFGDSRRFGGGIEFVQRLPVLGRRFESGPVDIELHSAHDGKGALDHQGKLGRRLRAGLQFGFDAAPVARQQRMP